jgi:murein DD-endopeptidase MepM/ murein hydrolase activator NlpD
MSTVHPTPVASGHDRADQADRGRRPSRSARVLFAGILAASAMVIPAAASATPVGQTTSTCREAGLAAHLVAEGDTWFGIAEGTQVSIRSLLEINGATRDKVIHPGDVVCLPPGASSSSCSPSNAPIHTVVSGDTWWDIAARAGVSMAKLLTANSTSAERAIRPGDTVCLPAGTSVRSSGTVSPGTASSRSRAASGWTSGIEALPMRGPCWFSDDWGDPRGGGRRHEGTDLFAAPRSYVYAVADGTLTRRAWDQPGLRSGNAWWLTTDDGTYYFYAHLADFAPGLSVGSRVAAGEIIGFMGNTGVSAFPHLHFEIHPGGGSAVNPYPLLRQLGGCRTGEQYRQPSGWVPD